MANENAGNAGSNAEGPITQDEASAEYRRAATDSTHPMHQAYKASLPSFSEWHAGLYRRAPEIAKAAPIAVSHPVTGGALTSVDIVDEPPVDSAFRENVLNEVWARGIEQAHIDSASRWLFSGRDGEALLGVFDDSLFAVAPGARHAAHVGMAQFLADLNDLRSKGKSDSDNAGPGPLDETQFQAALQERGMNPQAVNEAARRLFAGNMGAYFHFKRQLDRTAGQCASGGVGACCASLDDIGAVGAIRQLSVLLTTGAGGELASALVIIITWAARVAASCSAPANA